MDKSWINIPNRIDPRFIDGLTEFIRFAYSNKQPGSEIKCPCKRCRLQLNQLKKTVGEHVVMYGFLESYTTWDRHGETPVDGVLDRDNSTSQTNINDDMEGLIRECFDHGGLMGEAVENESFDGPDEESRKFFTLLENARTELYPGCKDFTLLSFIVRMLHTKSLCGWSNKSFTMQLQQLKAAYHPNDDKFPSSYYEARKFVKALGLEYKKVHACENDCMLFKDPLITKCLKCGAARYKVFEGEDDDDDDEGKKKRKVPVKVVRYFPFKERLQRLYMSSKTAKSMRWHAEERTKDGVLRHPADSLAWKTFDERYPDFAKDCRNVRLGLAADGVNPFKTMNVSHSTWPIILIPYNLPPWMCMKQPYFILSMVIDGPRSPGNDIDVYLQLLIDELKELWNDGVPTYDASSNQMFCMRAALLWTINDFPAYANLSGWSTKGKYACPCCNKGTRSVWLKHGKNFCYMGHRRFLGISHKFRDDKVSFDGTLEHQLKPPRLSGDELLAQLENLSTEYGKEKPTVVPKRRRKKIDSAKNSGREDNWKKRSVFFGLPYWKDLLIRHNIDIMHTEKNVCDNIIYTLLGVKGRSKDNLNARYDLELMGIRKGLHAKKSGSNNAYLPPASFTLSKENKDTFLEVLKNVKFPDGYASNIARCVKASDRTIIGLKSHDCHVLIEQLLPTCVRKVLPKEVSKTLIELSNCLRLLHSKVSRPSEFEALQGRIVLTLCHLEILFPPSFFDIMVHLIVHIAEEAMIAGPVHYRSMSSIERYLGTLKGYVRNRSRPEGSICEGYLAEECMTFCAMYLDDVESKLHRPARNDENVDDDSYGQLGKPIGKVEPFRLDEVSWVQAHRYVLFNLDGIDSFLEAHKVELRSQNPRASEFEIDKNHNKFFPRWFKNHVISLEKKGKSDSIPDNVKLIASYPDKWANRCSGYILNGLRFRTYQREKMLTTQNSGVQLCASTQSFSSRKDSNPVSGDVTYYGRIRDIIELSYTNEIKFALFKCDWINNARGRLTDDNNITLVNFNHLMYQQERDLDEPFILASQAQQVWYIQDPIDEDWHVVMKMTPRDFFDMGDQEHEPCVAQLLDDTSFLNEEHDAWVRTDIIGETVEISTVQKRKTEDLNREDGNEEHNERDAHSISDDGSYYGSEEDDSNHESEEDDSYQEREEDEYFSDEEE